MKQDSWDGILSARGYFARAEFSTGAHHGSTDSTTSKTSSKEPGSPTGKTSFREQEKTESSKHPATSHDESRLVWEKEPDVHILETEPMLPGGVHHAVSSQIECLPEKTNTVTGIDETITDRRCVIAENSEDVMQHTNTVGDENVPERALVESSQRSGAQHEVVINSKQADVVLLDNEESNKIIEYDLHTDLIENGAITSQHCREIENLDNVPIKDYNMTLYNPPTSNQDTVQINNGLLQEVKPDNKQYSVTTSALANKGHVAKLNNGMMVEVASPPQKQSKVGMIVEDRDVGQITSDEVFDEGGEAGLDGFNAHMLSNYEAKSAEKTSHDNVDIYLPSQTETVMPPGGQSVKQKGSSWQQPAVLKVDKVNYTSIDGKCRKPAEKPPATLNLGKREDTRSWSSDSMENQMTREGSIDSASDIKIYSEESYDSSRYSPSSIDSG